MIKLQEKYKKTAVPAIMKKFNLKSSMASPKIEKVIVNCGFGKQVVDKGTGERNKYIEHIVEYLGLIAGQKPSLRKAKQSIAAFKLREGSVIGAAVTLRGRKMYDFLERLVNIVLPRKRDFRGISLKAIDESGNLTIGFREYTPFPEVKVEREKGIFSLQVVVVIKSSDQEKTIELLRLLDFPLQKQEN